ncbi:MAG: hypothetical protein QM523_01585 [Candidatus Pacebacteria bacterium]|nr:hypothetical protein [Candidatus Paceibacterota bacterium]
MNRSIKNIGRGFASLGNFFGETGPLLPNAPRNRGEAWQRDWRKIGGDFQTVAINRGLVGDKVDVNNLDEQSRLFQLRLELAASEKKFIKWNAIQIVLTIIVISLLTITISTIEIFANQSFLVKSLYVALPLAVSFFAIFEGFRYGLNRKLIKTTSAIHQKIK